MPTEAIDGKFFDEMPKVDLHNHLDGALPDGTIFELAQRQGVVLPNIAAQTRQAVDEFFKDGLGRPFTTPADFNHFLAKFSVALAVMQTPEGLHDAALEHVRDLARQNHVYAETRFAPPYHQQNGLTMEQTIQAVLEGLNKGFVETGTLVKCIVCVPREVDAEQGEAVAQAALKFQDKGVVALDLACNEMAHPPEKHRKAFEATFGSKLKRTVHAGELPKNIGMHQRAKNIRTAINELHADGIGHGIGLAQNRFLLSKVNKKGIRVESCPLSNMIIGAIDDVGTLEIRRMLRSGVLVTLNTDDSAIMGTPLAQVFRETAIASDLKMYDVKGLLGNAIRGAFCSQEEKDYVSREFMRRGMPLQ